MIGIRRTIYFSWGQTLKYTRMCCVEICSLGRYTTVYGRITKQHKEGYSFWTLWFGSWVSLACALVTILSFGHFGADWLERYWRNK